MASINEIKNRLPKEFVENLYNLFSPGTVDKILAGTSEQRATTLRVNNLKFNIQDLMKLFKENNIKFDRIPWYRDGLVIKNAVEKDIKKLKIYENGYIYLQSTSSMVPPCVLDPKPGEIILDLTAAPGSKTTQIAAMMNNEGYILANELDKIRCERLKFNVNNQGAKIVEVINGRGEKIGSQYPEKFDKILLDTPCSGEGRFLAYNPGTYRDWSLKRVNELVKIQKKLFTSAYNALKPGGIIVYSTCTINKEENEYILNWALQNLKIEILDISLEIKNSIPGSTEGLDSSIRKSIKILPSKETEGFFVAKLRKISSESKI
ncbi:MAG TPA: RsmB/NOP family class I SAM-dependent RNA methyltransferase [Bacteroidales bacterium]|nr:RsmB/NOP family class I SAM-dependent RNA methyltransferase [Bacteroidales bacterium]